MPKVSEEYINNKKSEIVNAAFEVCKRKTVCTVTMQDVIDESGLSQGGIYRFFNNIDEILACVLDKIRKESSIDERVDDFLSKYENATIEEATKQIFKLMADTMKKDLFPYYKIEFEYNTLIANFPERAKKIYTTKKMPGLYKHFFEVLVPHIKNRIQNGIIKPIIPLNEIFDFNSAVFDGILKQAIYHHYYEQNVNEDKNFSYNIEQQFKMMYISTCNFLGINFIEF